MTKQEVDESIRRVGGLTDDQFRAVTDDSQTVLTLACAGSGKSRTLAYRVARIVATEESPESIVAFTFTESAAEAMKMAIATALSQLGLSPTNLGRMHIGTIHSYCKGFLSEEDPEYRQYAVLDENRLLLFVYSIASTLSWRDLAAAHARPDRERPGEFKTPGVFETVREVVNAWQLVHDEMIDMNTVIGTDPNLGNVLQAIEDRLHSVRCVDFSQLVSHAVKVLSGRTELSVRHLLVDEYQDINPAQEAIIQNFRRLGASLFVVGDDDQAVYAWRGADVTMIRSFERRYAGSGIHVLPMNFRSTEPIVAASNEFAEKTLNTLRIEKSPHAVYNREPQELGALWFDDRADEADWVAGRVNDMIGVQYDDDKTAGGLTTRGLTPGDFAILMRSTKSHHAPFSAALEALGVKYSLRAGNEICSDPMVAALIKALELLRSMTPTRSTAQQCFDSELQPVFPSANFEQFAGVLNRWGSLVHTPAGQRRRVTIQGLLQEMLAALGVARDPLSSEEMRVLGQFSKIIEDVETIYVSVDSADRYREVLNFLAQVAPNAYELSTDDLVATPDAVTISTVHGVKGLEFPVVFVVDVDALRFPHRNETYRGWVPRSLVSGAVDRGSYCTTLADEARLFYTALTRSERFLYVTGSAMEPSLQKPRKRGAFFDQLASSASPEMVHDLPGVSTVLDRTDPKPRASEPNLPTSFSEIHAYLTCPMQYQFRYRWNFSPPINEMVGFGITVHTIIEKLHATHDDRAPDAVETSAMVDQTFHLPHAFRSRSQNAVGPYERAQMSADEMVQRYVQDHKTDFERTRTVEAPFEIQVCGAVLSGSIDLLMRDSVDGTPLDAELIDFKAMKLDGGSIGSLDWTALSLQVQLYARAAQDVLGTPVRLGSVHMLKDGVRVHIPVDTEAQNAAIANVEWAVNGILQGDFPMRPQEDKCSSCDFHRLCSQRPEGFSVPGNPPRVHAPVQHAADGTVEIPAVAQFDGSHMRV